MHGRPESGADVATTDGAEADAVRRRFELALRAGRVGTFVIDLGTGRLDLDAVSRELMGLEPATGETSYDDWIARIHQEDREATRAAVRAAIAGGHDAFEVEYRFAVDGGRPCWLRGTGRFERDGDGRASRVYGVVADVTARRAVELEREAAMAAEQVARDAAAQSQRRLELLARAASLLDSPLDLDATLQRVADLAVERLADWCVVDLVDDRSVHHAAVAHRDPAMIAVARKAQERYPSDPDDPGLTALMQSLEPVYVPQLSDEMLVQGARDEEHLQLMRDLGMSSAVAVPLQTQGRGVGVMTLIGCHGRFLTPEDRDLAMELGRRAGAAVEKARLYAERDRVARTLQRSLLPPMLPDVPGMTLAAHYRPATAGVDIGGDFYDVFRSHADRWWVVLGDVCGKGAEAAALTGAIRYVLRAVTLDVDDPGEALRRLNEALVGQEWGGRFATVLLMTFHAAGGEGPVDVALANGGHPPPFVRRADGEVEQVEVHGMLLGLLAEVRASATTVRLGPGESLLLYTDGATEARRPDGTELGDEGVRRLLAGAGAGAETVIAHVADGLDRIVGPAGLRDDLALLALTRSSVSPAQPVGRLRA